MIDLLKAAKRPLFLLGAGAREVAPEIIAFCEEWAIPMETTWNAIDLVSWEHPLFVGRPGIVATRGANMAIQNCDLLVAIGARLDQPTIAYDYKGFAPRAKKVLVDVDMAESVKIPNLDYFVHKTAREWLNSLQGEQFLNLDYAPWLDKCAEWKKTRLEGETTTYQVMENLSDELPGDAVIVMSCGCMAVNIFCAGFRNKPGQRFIMSSCGLGSMGAAIPVAIGAALASGRPVYCIDGDGSFMQNIQELEVVRRLKLPIIFLVMNNGGYASIRSSERRAFGRTNGSESIPNIKEVSKAFGVHAVDYGSYFDHSIMNKWGTPLVLNVSICEEELPLPRVMFDGRGCLEDMYPYQEKA